MVVDTRNLAQLGMFYGNLTDDGETNIGYITPPHDYVLFTFSHQKWNSHNRNGQNYGDCTLWIIELDSGESYVSTTIVAMGWGLGIGGGSYTFPADPTPPPASIFGGTTQTLVGVIPVVVVLGIIVMFVGIFLGGEKKDNIK
jgi:hypothetical protein